MTELLIIADDLTGALDTGVKFSQKGAYTEICIDYPEYRKTGKTADVLVVNTDSRHLPMTEAYKRVFDVVSYMYERGVRKFYKKTDSVLRGNVGSEIRAMQDAVKGVPVFFAPAYPTLGRTTVNGIQYVDGVPVSETIFGKDPFSPVLFSDIAELINTQNAGIAKKIPAGVIPEGESDEIFIFDAENDGDLADIARNLYCSPLLMGGCGGFANAVFDRCGLYKKTSGRRQVLSASGIYLPNKAVVFSGSLNPVTQSQTAALQNEGISYTSFTSEQLKRPHFSDSDECADILSQVASTAPNVVAIGSCADPSALSNLSSVELIREQVSHNLGEIGKQLLDIFANAVFIVVGGDTFLAMLRSVESASIIPISEPLPGCVLCEAAIRGQSRYFITKSGGFGNDETLKALVGYVTSEHGFSNAP